MNVQRQVPSAIPAGTGSPDPVALQAVALIEQALAQVLIRQGAPAPRQAPDPAAATEYDSWLASLH